MNKNISDFYLIAKKLCCFLTGEKASKGDIRFILTTLMEIYSAAFLLPDYTPETEYPSVNDSEGVTPLRIHLDFQTTYWEVFDPIEEQESVCSDLIDDFTDIFNDLQRGICEYDAGRIGNAVFEWKFGFNNHWGQHVVDAIRALHALRTD